jgi:6-phosphofructokinase 1
VGVPKTLDNDLSGTEYCIGFDTAVGIVMEALDRLHTTAASHHRLLILETMGRETGWLATMGGLAGGADFIIIPEFPTRIEEIVDHIHRRREGGSAFSIVVVAEGVRPSDLGLGEDERAAPEGIGHFLAHELGSRTGFETRCTVLGYVQRGGSPSAHDRIWATRVGSASYEAVLGRQWGTIPVVRQGRVHLARLDEVIDYRRGVPADLYELCRRYF